MEAHEADRRTWNTASAAYARYEGRRRQRPRVRPSADRTDGLLPFSQVTPRPGGDS